jgi:site-specific DNA-cytosine methylase
MVDAGLLPGLEVKWTCDWLPSLQRWLHNVLGVPLSNIFSDINARSFLSDGWAAKNVEGSEVRVIREVDSIDLYVAGFPCTPFSSKGKQAQWDDTNAKPFWQVVQTIIVTRPLVAILENVMGLKRAGGLDTVLRVLRAINGYYVAVLSGLSNHQFGIPQHRERIYIVMLRRNATQGKHVVKRLTEFVDNCKVTDCPDWPKFLELHGLPLRTLRGPPADLCWASGLCKCHLRRLCKVHTCKCRRCHSGKNMKCIWRKSHKAYTNRIAVRHATKEMLMKWRMIRTVAHV